MLTRKVKDRFLVRLETGEEVLESLRLWAMENGVDSAALQGIGALRRAVLGHFDAVERTYRHLPVDEQVEVACLTGNITLGEGNQHVVHAHVVLGRADGQTLSGHLVEGLVCPTLELVLSVIPELVMRRRDPTSGLALWDI